MCQNPRLIKIEEHFIQNAKEWLSLNKNQDSQGIIERMARLKAKLGKEDIGFVKSYEIMYELLDATEKQEPTH